jgi:hypothetical protein
MKILILRRCKQDNQYKDRLGGGLLDLKSASFKNLEFWFKIDHKWY